MRTTVIIPTYNERATLATVVTSLLGLRTDGDLDILVVDDGSPDGTGDVADALHRDAPSRVHVLHRARKEGLGRAYIAGFDWALSHGADRIVEMDADLSHDPAALPSLLAATADADLVLGSRYVAGGSTVNWNWTRRMISRWGNWYARTVLGVPIRDLTGGYKVFRRTVLETIAYRGAESIGYNFQIELTYRALRHGLRVVEVPIRFTERVEGESKFHFGIMIEGFWKVLLLRRSGRPQGR